MAGTLPLRYFAARFVSKIPTWRLPPGGEVAGLVTDGGEGVGLVRVEPFDQGDASSLDARIGGYWLVGLVEVVNEFDLTEKLLHTS